MQGVNYPDQWLCRDEQYLVSPGMLSRGVADIRSRGRYGGSPLEGHAQGLSHLLLWVLREHLCSCYPRGPTGLCELPQYDLG